MLYTKRNQCPGGNAKNASPLPTLLKNVDVTDTIIAVQGERVVPQAATLAMPVDLRQAQDERILNLSVI